CSLLYLICSDPHRVRHCFPTRRSSDLELTQARLTRQISHRTAEKGPGGAGPLSHSREDFEEGIPCLSVDGVVVFSSQPVVPHAGDRKSTRLNSSHVSISYAVVCLKNNK